MQILTGELITHSQLEASAKIRVLSIRLKRKKQAIANFSRRLLSKPKTLDPNGPALSRHRNQALKQKDILPEGCIFSLQTLDLPQQLLLSCSLDTDCIFASSSSRPQDIQFLSLHL